MQNPFIQLRKYPPEVTDPSENRATETLAACLVFSEDFRRRFLRFLFKEKLPCESMNAASCEISTQHTTTKNQRVDLFLEQEGEWAIVVEVKVKANEDPEQIRNYQEWLDESKDRKNYVFHLVKNHDRNFKIEDHGGAGTRTWKELYDDLSQTKQGGLGTTEANLVEHFCNYLEVEGIVSTWKPEEILPYTQGVTASRALTNLFEQVASRLKDIGSDYQTRIVFKGDEWPRLEVGRTSWRPLVGEGSRLTNVWACYQTSDYPQLAWPWRSPLGGELPRFYFQIVLWARWRGTVWDLVRPKIPACLKALLEQGFGVWGWPEANKGAVAIVGDDYKFEEPLNAIAACSLDANVALITNEQFRRMTADVLVDEVYKRTLRHCDIFSRLC